MGKKKLPGIRERMRLLREAKKKARWRQRQEEAARTARGKEKLKTDLKLQKLKNKIAISEAVGKAKAIKRAKQISGGISFKEALGFSKGKSKKKKGSGNGGGFGFSDPLDMRF